MLQTPDTIFLKRPLAHHAYGIETHTLNVHGIREYLGDDFSYVYDRYFETFKIDDARAVRSLQNEKTDLGSVFIIGFNQITNDAENALLKILEEPTENTFFILLFPFAKNLLPTLRSRLMIHTLEGEAKTSDNPLESFRAFSACSLSERFDLIQKNVKGKESIVTKTHVLELLNQAEASFEKPSKITEVLFLKKCLMSSTSPSVKMILDHLAMIS